MKLESELIAANERIEELEEYVRKIGYCPMCQESMYGHFCQRFYHEQERKTLSSRCIILKESNDELLFVADEREENHRSAFMERDEARLLAADLLRYMAKTFYCNMIYDKAHLAMAELKKLQPNIENYIAVFVNDHQHEDV